MIAASYLQWKICELLIKKDINIGHKSNKQQTVLHILGEVQPFDANVKFRNSPS